MRKSSFPLCTTSPSQRRGKRHGRGGGGGEQHRTALALAVTCAIISNVKKVRTEILYSTYYNLHSLFFNFYFFLFFIFFKSGQTQKRKMCITLKISLPGVSIVTRQAGLTVYSLSVVSAVALTCLVVTVSSEWVAMAIALTWHTATTTSQGWTKTTWTTVLTMGPCSPIWKIDKEQQKSTVQVINKTDLVWLK